MGDPQNQQSFKETCLAAERFYKKLCDEYGTENLRTTVQEDNEDYTMWADVTAVWETTNSDGIVSRLYFSSYSEDTSDEGRVYILLGLIYDTEYLESESIDFVPWLESSFSTDTSE